LSRHDVAAAHIVARVLTAAPGDAAVAALAAIADTDDAANAASAEAAVEGGLLSRRAGAVRKPNLMWVLLQAERLARGAAWHDHTHMCSHAAGGKASATASPTAAGAVGVAASAAAVAVAPSAVDPRSWAHFYETVARRVGRSELRSDHWDARAAVVEQLLLLQSPQTPKTPALDPSFARVSAETEPEETATARAHHHARWVEAAEAEASLHPPTSTLAQSTMVTPTLAQNETRAVRAAAHADADAYARLRMAAASANVRLLRVLLLRLLPAAEDAGADLLLAVSSEEPYVNDVFGDARARVAVAVPIVAHAVLARLRWSNNCSSPSSSSSGAVALAAADAQYGHIVRAAAARARRLKQPESITALLRVGAETHSKPGAEGSVLFAALWTMLRAPEAGLAPNYVGAPELRALLAAVRDSSACRQRYLEVMQA
jgi:hypothetical protein